MTGLLLALGSALLWALANTFIGDAARRFGALGALIGAQIAGLLLMGAVAPLAEGAPGALDTSGVIWLGVGAISAAAAYGGLFEAFRLGQLAVIAPIISSWSVISVITGLLAFDEHLSGIAALGVAAVIAGNVTLARFRETHDPDAGAPRTPPRAIVFALISVAGFGAMLPAVDQIGAQIGRLWTVIAVWSLEIALLLALLAARRALPSPPRSLREVFSVARVGLFEVGGFLCMSLAIGLAPMAIVGPVASLSTLFSVAIGVLILREPLPRPALIGAAIASAGVVLVGF